MRWTKWPSGCHTTTKARQVWGELILWSLGTDSWEASCNTLAYSEKATEEKFELTKTSCFYLQSTRACIVLTCFKQNLTFQICNYLSDQKGPEAISCDTHLNATSLGCRSIASTIWVKQLPKGVGSSLHCSVPTLRWHHKELLWEAKLAKCYLAVQTGLLGVRLSLWEKHCNTVEDNKVIFASVFIWKSDNTL